MHAIEAELRKALKIKKPFDDQQDLLNAILIAMDDRSKFTDADYDNLSDEAAEWHKAAVAAKDDGDEIPDFEGELPAGLKRKKNAADEDDNDTEDDEEADHEADEAAEYAEGDEDDEEAALEQDDDEGADDDSDEDDGEAEEGAEEHAESNGSSDDDAGDPDDEEGSGDTDVDSDDAEDEGDQAFDDDELDEAEETEEVVLKKAKKIAKTAKKPEPEKPAKKAKPVEVEAFKRKYSKEKVPAKTKTPEMRKKLAERAPTQGTFPKPDYEAISKDGERNRFGIVKGTKTDEAIKMYLKGATGKQIMERLGGRYYNILTKLQKEGHRIEKDGAVWKLIHKDDVKAAKKKAK